MRYDLHIHTKYSSDSKTDPFKLLKTAKKRKLNGIAVTDHDSIKGGIETSKLNKDKDFEVIIGSEIRTDKADILAYYIQEDIKTDNFFEAIDKIKEQNGLAVIAHPFSSLRNNLSIPFSKIKNIVDGIECFNGRAILPYENSKALKMVDKYNLAKTGSSDAHLLYEVAQGTTIFEGNLREALKKRKTRIEGKNFHAYPIYPIVVLRKILSF